ncbi:unnamed protein product [Phyllotreta striolata]|uniref:WD and tetratricopeptide repeats protein 1 n=1 Tax=Phyllotreta striolata TaxID=444603 RepID=A0A9N9TJ72_PHYSR|nr:unnamed protein product [Phyllotreta striolata]
MGFGPSRGSFAILNSDSDNMESKLKKWRTRRDFLKLLQSREYKAETSRYLNHHSQFTDSLIKRFGLEHELEGHQGCVNCLEWTPNGQHLASGSDDTNVILWDPFRHKKLEVIPTHHIGNIFSVKFIGTSCNEIATASGDCRVMIQSIQTALAKGLPILECNCHINRVKRLATSPSEPTLFWSAAEDGLVIQYDLREPHECSPSQTKVLIDLCYNFGEVKCIAINPTKPHYMAVGANDCFVRLYDRRMLKPYVSRQKRGPLHLLSDRLDSKPSPGDSNCCQYYSPGHLAVENSQSNSFKLAVTNVSFDATGSEMLANVGGEHIYLFDVNKSRYIEEIRAPAASRRPPSGSKRRAGVCSKCWTAEKNGCVNTSKTKWLSDDNCVCFYLDRAFECLQRKWLGDLYNAARDFLHVIRTWPSTVLAYVGLIESLLALNWAKEAQQWLDYFETLPIVCDNPTINSFRFKLEKLLEQPAVEKEPNDAEENERFRRRVDEIEQKKRLESLDFETRFVGHCNITTDIKEANFLGADGNYICAGSDDGIIFVWERKRCGIVTAVVGDVSIVNCIQPHPSACLIASSGIDTGVKLWSPLPEPDDEYFVNPRGVSNIPAVVEANQHRMAMDPLESMLINMGYRLSDMPVPNEVPSCQTS